MSDKKIRYGDTLVSPGTDLYKLIEDGKTKEAKALYNEIHAKYLKMSGMTQETYQAWRERVGS